jgi:hypothetical protein
MRRALTFAEEGSYAEAAQFLRSAADAFEAEAKRGHVSIDRGKE